MRQTVIAAMKAFLSRRGILVDRYNCSTSIDLRLVRMLETNGIDLVLDVGANQGHYGRNLRAAGYANAILSFEPLADPYADLAGAVERDPLWEVAPRMALGAAEGTVQINVAANSTSSSVLPMLNRHTEAAPESVYISAETVTLRRLDGVSHPLLRQATAPFLKIDTQGYEREVIVGAAGLLPLLRGIQLELSIVPLYDGQPSWLTLHGELEAQGFALWSVVPGFFEPATARMLQFDAVYFRR